ncbi:nuclear transport factor 2 family protein [Sulfitobacter pseudonitzschiae]|uniref:Nuclear transport factor 2 family protein n=1 Tax=Pseudosulfitobacter pseudonitzschiae TaxID=1402135 RepID=A0A9Q2NRW0_9RHOB|nr:nuclear transport factor 2 family protein [Pseudosulfitobacter pseudonitzschiae]MBM2294553.1 nuclear transport factor 2 family protein [Pseudosulfitobacter pseudonitzschiae]MBM2299367.1 nuclear transport factor 2 family protein [Pseudosulfitobacter pseudonitzschiae]MBM2304419.1 nuclear transport factor 2 family protein [Pseudosulfitobacter pseudonitzschiae]MBM2314165.1 nuclear transport factor 2 family protein [Pseudosulfitobacter pseudonitzschiae]MBM2319080.1 nuclear transport factor 2 fam
MTDENEKLRATLVACEKTVWDALVSGDVSGDAQALDEGFLGVYSDGFATKDDHTGQLKNGATVDCYELAETRVMSLGGNHAVLSYRAVFRRKGFTVEEEMYVSSIWRRDADRWRNVFSQDTPAISV